LTIRVLHCIYDDVGNPWVGGGGAVRVEELYRRLEGRVECQVATGNYPGAAERKSGAARYVHLGSPRSYVLSRLTYARSATRLLAEGEYDAAVIDFSVYTPIHLPVGRRVGITVHHVTGPTARERWGRTVGSLLAHRERRILQRSRWFSATSRATFDALRPLVPVDSRIRLVQAGVPDELFELTRMEEEFLLYFGRIDFFQKGLDVLLEGFAEVARSRPHLRLKMAGRGKDSDRVRASIRQLGLQDRVDLLGPVDEPVRRSLFAGALVLMMPSRFEGFGMVAAEGMAAGLPIVASDAGSLPEVISPPAGGILVPAGNATALAHEVTRLLEEPSLRARLSGTARRSAERFRWDRVAADHLAFLQEITGVSRDED